jgi:hypothetical protein
MINKKNIKNNNNKVIPLNINNKITNILNNNNNNNENMIHKDMSLYTYN